MVKKLGSNIAALRKARGMTQEQLAMAVGVSAPAVSKWETDSSYPDIALLCPIARALRTNVDTLLEFENTISDEELTRQINEIVTVARTEGCSRAEKMLQKLLHTYPSSMALKFQAAMVMDMFVFFGPEPLSPGETDERWKRQKKQLLEEIYRDGFSPYWQDAVCGLASIALSEGQADEAEELLKKLPEHTVDTTQLWAQLYLKRGEAEKAREKVQRRLYTLISKAFQCLTMMMNEKIETDGGRMLEICQVYRELEAILGIGGGLSAGFFVEAYGRLGRKKEQMESMIELMEAACRPLLQPNPVLFSTMVKKDGEKATVTPEMKKMLLKGIKEDDTYSEFWKDQRFAAAMARMQESIEKDNMRLAL